MAKCFFERLGKLSLLALTRTFEKLGKLGNACVIELSDRFGRLTTESGLKLGYSGIRCSHGVSIIYFLIGDRFCWVSRHRAKAPTNLAHFDILILISLARNTLVPIQIISHS